MNHDLTRNMIFEDDTAASPALEPPLTAEEKAKLLQSLDEADVPEQFRQSIRRDLDAL